MKYLVTGGAGFIGSNLANHLSKNHQVQVFDNLMYGSHQLDNLHDKHIVKGDVSNYHDLLDCDKPDVIFHLAALSSAPICSADPTRAILVNEYGFSNILQFARRSNARVVYASTSSMYNNNPIPWSEDMMIKPRTVYESTFHNRETIAFGFYHEYRVPAVGLRFFSIFGPHESHKKHYANYLTQLIWDYQNNRRPEVYGDGNQSRDYVYVDDVVGVLVKVAERDDIDCDIFNIGTGITTSVNDIIQILNERFGYVNEPHYIESPINNYVVKTCANNSKICSQLKWQPRISLLNGIDKQISNYA